MCIAEVDKAETEPWWVCFKVGSKFLWRSFPLKRWKPTASFRQHELLSVTLGSISVRAPSREPSSVKLPCHDLVYTATQDK